ncbi:MAG: hypothetical protein ABI852_08830 [Gemmatimonadaceae bacterium]
MTFGKNIKKALRRAIFPSGLLARLEKQRITQGKILAELNRDKPVIPIHDCEFSIFSQFGEDGIIQKLVRTLPMPNHTFIEFGVEDFAESNCRFLMMNDNWRGFVVDGSDRWISALQKHDWFWKFDLRAKCAMITRDNVNDVLRESGFDRDVGILSIDVDGVDYWLLEALNAFSPRVLIVEYNSLFGSERSISVPYQSTFVRRQQHYSDLYFGASLGAFAHLAGTKGYSLIGTERAGVNAFFVRNDLLTDSVRAVSVAEAFHQSTLRQSRNREGALDFLTLEQRTAAIKGMPVVNVLTGATETF